MKRKQMSLGILCLMLICAMAVNMSGCATEVDMSGYETGINAVNMIEDITPRAVESKKITSENSVVTDFAIRLFDASDDGENNTLISPLSVLTALAMSTNGAQGTTRQQMEEALGMSAEELNVFLFSYMKVLGESKGGELSIANSLWFKNDERFQIKQSFLQTIADYYGADVYKITFDDKACNEMNKWVSAKTDGMIEKILDKIAENAVVYLVNALTFEAEWSAPYYKSDIIEGEFTKEDGTTQIASYMTNSESVYLQDEKASGFMKYYKGGDYAFVAMLPNERVSVSEYIDYLSESGAGLISALLGNSQKINVRASLPKFETGYDAEMSGILQGMGMELAFNAENADFGELGRIDNANIYISRVLHKTYISVGQTGTKAGASTVIEHVWLSDDPPDTKSIVLNRPFVYMIIDCNNNIPLFIGTMMDIEG
ncbi:MAG: serpin family protein [Clostridia bacterium]|nr:serpin family protein [Clostridia bacterium]